MTYRVSIRAKEKRGGREREGRRFLSLRFPAPYPQLPTILKIQQGRYDLTTNRDSGFRAPLENVIVSSAEFTEASNVN